MKIPTKRLILKRVTVEDLNTASGAAESTASPCGPTKWTCPPPATDRYHYDGTRNEGGDGKYPCKVHRE